MSSKVVLSILAVAVLLAGGLYVFSGSDEKSLPAPSAQQQENTIEEQTEAEEEDYDRLVEMTMKNFEYSMDQIQAAPGEKVRVVIENMGGTHDFVIDELNVQSEVVSSGEKLVVDFQIPADKSGVFKFYCSIGNHRQLGMEGDFVVSGL